MKIRAIFLSWTLGQTAALGASVYHDFGSAGDLDPNSPMYFIKGAPDRSAIWHWKTSIPMAFYENDQDFFWVKTPSNPEGYTSSRGIHFRRSAILRINASGFPSSGTAYLTIRFKDNLRRGSHDGAPLWSSRRLLGTIGGQNDHRWKTQTLKVDLADLELVDGTYRIRMGSNYSDDLAGELDIDKVKLSTDQALPEFAADAPGLWPAIPADKDRFKNIGRDNEYIPGEGPFFPFGMYLTVGLITDGGSKTTPGKGPKDTWQILEDVHINTAVIHGWQQNWSSRWAVYPNEAPWASPGQYVEPGLDEMLVQAQGHGIKLIPNFLTDTRAYWIDRVAGGSPAVLEKLSAAIRRNADHPALLAWNPVDEWDHEDAAFGKPHLFSRQLYKICKENSPNRPVFTSLMGFNRGMGWQVAADISDVFGNDRYFDEGDDPAFGAQTQASYLDDMRRVYGDSKGIIAILHFGTTQSEIESFHGVKRVPNEQEIVFQAYMAIAHGAQGLLYFRMVHPDTDLDYPGLDSGWRGFRRLGDELFGDRGIAPVLIAPSRTVDVMGEKGVVKSSNPNIHFILKETVDGALVLIAVNMTESNQDTTFTVSGLGAGSIPVHFEERSVAAASDRFSDSFQSFDRRVYVLRGWISGSRKPIRPDVRVKVAR